MASDYLLVMDGIKGDSGDTKYKESIEVESFSWGASNPGTSGRGSGAGSGKVSVQDLHFSMHVNKSSPNLFLACAEGTHFKKSVLICRKQGKTGGQLEFLKITLEDVMVSSYQTGGSNGSSAIPIEQVSLNAAKYKIEYAPQKTDGTMDAFVPAGYDVVMNKKI